MTLVLLAVLLVGCAVPAVDEPEEPQRSLSMAERGREATADRADEPAPEPADPCDEVLELADTYEQEFRESYGIISSRDDASETEKDALFEALAPRFKRELERLNILAEQNPQCFTADFRVGIEELVRSFGWVPDYAY